MEMFLNRFRLYFHIVESNVLSLNYFKIRFHFLPLHNHHLSLFQQAKLHFSSMADPSPDDIPSRRRRRSADDVGTELRRFAVQPVLPDFRSQARKATDHTASIVQVQRLRKGLPEEKEADLPREDSQVYINIYNQDEKYRFISLLITCQLKLNTLYSSL